MSKIYKKLNIIFVMAFAIILGCFTNVLAADNGVIGTINLNGTAENSAKVGQQLAHPEKGWKRYDDADSNITYSSGWAVVSNSGRYNGSEHYINSTGAIIKFNFYGTKIRMMCDASSNRTKNLSVAIDGIVQNVGQYANPEIYQMLFFEKTGLDLKEHTVIITTNDSSTALLDSIDIDEIGKLLPYDYTTLTATASTTNTSITLNWNKVDGATGYNIKKSITQGSGYTTIVSNVTENTYNDTAIQAGITYYYVVVPIINGIEGTQSNEAFATVNKPTETGNAILTITMTNGNVKSYTVSMTKVNDFISWYNNRSSGSNGIPYYAFDKADNLQPFTKKTEYVVFDKISSFEVDEYSK
ncbi:MAG: fibronectin type III domain-containing protein [Clostridiaceae bacterium]|nr:fibronectin type III domain-containing protein [Clostridiaceae bacterium]